MQMLFHELSDKTDFPGEAKVLVGEFDLLVKTWGETFPEDKGSGEPESFLELLSSFRVVLRCCLEKDWPAPSAVRHARQVLSTAADANSPPLSASAMMHYDFSGMAMDKARDVAAVGMQDAAADSAFDAAVRSLEALVEVAFEDAEAWESGGGP